MVVKSWSSDPFHQMSIAPNCVDASVADPDPVGSGPFWSDQDPDPDPDPDPYK
jgi:hypothetical protein